MNKDNINKLTSIEYARATDFSPIVRIYPKIARNTICPHTGKKFKNCCGQLNQDFCEKARDSLKNYLMKIANEKKNTVEEEKKS